mgnify:FL=1
MTTTLTDLQTDRAELAALAAQRELAEALAASRPAEALTSAAAAVQSVITRALAALPDRFARAIAGENDETRVHYLLSDAAHDLLDEIGRQAEQVAASLPEFGERFRKGARPRDLLTVSQWADRERWITSGTNAPGQWNTALTPYLRDIMDDLSEHSPVRTVVFLKASGVGGTEALFNWVAYVMAHLGNRDMLAVCSTLELRDRSFNPRLSKLFRETPALTDLVSRAARNASNRADVLEYGPTAKLIKAGANSPDSLSSDHIPYVVCDEVDRYPWDVGGEGDPMTLIANRQRSFTRAKTFLLSTPTNADYSRIDQAYRESDRRRYHVPCPHCGEFHVLERQHLRWRLALDPFAATAKKSQTVEAAWFVCPHCGSEIHEGHKTAMLAAGRWVAERPHLKLTHGYQINGAYAPIGLGLSWKQIAQRWVSAQEDTTKKRAVINTDWGEVFREEGEGADDAALAARCEPYTRADLERAGVLRRVTAWVDVQKDRLEFTVFGWGDGEEAWVVEHHILPGDTALPDTWEDLGAALAQARVDVAGVDAGYNTTLVLKFCESRAWCTPTKGVTGTARPIIEDALRRRQRLRRARRKGNPIEPIGVDQAKAILYARLKQEKAGPGYLHFPKNGSIDSEYFAQLAAEELRIVLRAGRRFPEWVAIRPRNEALDCAVGNLAVCRLAGPLPKSGSPRRSAWSAEEIAEAISPTHRPPADTPQQREPAPPPNPPRRTAPQRPIAQRLGW